MTSTLRLAPSKTGPTTEFGRRLVQVQVAAAIEPSQRVIGHYETVAECPTVHALVALAKVLSISTDEWLGLKPPPRVEAPRHPREEKRLWRHLKLVAKLPERDQRAVLRLNTAARAGKSA